MQLLQSSYENHEITIFLFPLLGLASPLFPDHRQILSSRLMAQDSPPISPLLYSPTGYNPTQHHVHQLHQIPMQTQQYAAALASGNATVMQQQQLLKPATTTAQTEIWAPVPKNEYAIVASVTQAYTYDGAGSSGAGAYQQQSPHGFIHPVPKIEVDTSPVNLSMEVQQQ